MLDRDRVLNDKLEIALVRVQTLIENKVKIIDAIYRQATQYMFLQNSELLYKTLNFQY